MSERYDAIIIGAGVIGACVALELSRAGYKTLSLDKGGGAGLGSTAGSCAIIRTYYSALETCAIAYEGWFYWKDWAGYLGHEDPRGMIKYHDVGCLVTKTEHNGHLANVCEMMDRLGCPYEHLSPEAMREKVPVLDLKQYWPPKRPDQPGFGEATGPNLPGGVFFPRGGYVSDPALSAQNAEHAAKQHGARFRYHAEVAEILQAGGRVAGVKLTDGTEIHAPIVVNVAGPHSSKINKMAGVFDAMNIKTRALRHEVAHVPAPEGYDFEAVGCVTSDSDIATYARPEKGNYVLIGSEDPECDSREWVDPDHWNRDFTEQATVQAMRLAQRFEGLPIPSRMQGVVELYDVTDDWIPIYDKSDLPGFYLAIGTSGNQFKNAPVAGKMMHRLIETCEGGQDHDKEPVDFHLQHVERTIDLGFFSRNREINQNSTFSVLG